MKGGLGYYQPVFARESLTTGQSYEVEIVDIGVNKYFMIGVATAECRNKPTRTFHPNVLCIFGYDSTLSFEGGK